MQASRLTAIGGVLLAAAVVMIQVRMDSAWSHGVMLAVAGVCFVVIFGLGFAGPLGDDGGVPRPTAEQSALLLAALVMLVAAVDRLGQVTTGTDSADSPGTVAWMALAFTLLAIAPAVKRRSAVCALAAAAGFGVFATQFVNWVDSGPLEAKGIRWIFFGLLVIYALAAVVLRGRRRHAAAMVNASMLAVIAILEVSGVLFGLDEGDTGILSTWWEIVVLLAPLLAIGYALLMRERGPGWTAGVALLVAALAVGIPNDSGGSLVGWPLVFLIAAALALVAGMAMPRRT
jgi:hypothetical protein